MKIKEGGGKGGEGWRYYFSTFSLRKRYLLSSATEGCCFTLEYAEGKRILKKKGGHLYTKNGKGTAAIHLITCREASDPHSNGRKRGKTESGERKAIF